MFFLNDTATTEIYTYRHTLSLHDALPISITGSAEPISAAERQARIARAQRLMRESGLSALLIEPGARLVYFTGVQWGRSERLTAAEIPVEGAIAVVTAFFEEPSCRQRDTKSVESGTSGY